MMLSDIKLHTPQTLSDALGLLGKIKNSRAMAGGTDLLVDLKQGLLDVKDLVSLQKIEDLRGIEEKDGIIRIGVLTTPAEIAAHPLIALHIPALGEAAGSMASSQIRSMATIGGNISSAVPSADLPPSLIAAGAGVTLNCADSSREISLAEYFLGPRETVCRGNELLSRILVPLPPAGTGISYKKFVLREANALAVASSACKLTLTQTKITEVSVVLGAVAPIPLPAGNAMEILKGQAPSDGLFEKAAAAAAEEAKPISDLRGSASFRKELVLVLTRRALNEALNRAQAAKE